MFGETHNSGQFPSLTIIILFLKNVKKHYLKLHCTCGGGGEVHRRRKEREREP